MAENPMVKERLTDSMIDAGADLIQQLDQNGLPITAALWLFDAETNDWRLLVASPEADTRGPRYVYKRIQDAIEQLGSKSGDLPLSLVGLLDSQANLLRLLKLAIHTGPDLARIRFSRNVIQGHYIDDALVYRA